MIAFGVYLLKVSVCLTVLYSVYLCLFRTITFFRFNRGYLLLGLAAAFVIPMLNLSLVPKPYDITPSQSLIRFIGEPLDGHAASMGGTPGTLNNNQFLFVSIYFLGAGLMISKLAYFLIGIIWLRRRSEPLLEGDLKFFKAKGTLPFSFFNLVFIPEGSVDPLIIRHESVHIRQLHWIDLLLVEMACLVLWFNPVVFLYKRSIKIQHEYLADACTLSDGVPPQQYLACLLSHLYVENGLEFTSHFYSKSIKQRIIMMTKKETSAKLYSRYLFVVPVLIVLLFIFSNKPAAADLRSDVHEVSITDDNRPSITPVETAKVTGAGSGFGMRLNPYLKKKAFHTGIDFALPEGEPVMSTANGVVVKSINDPQWGNLIVVKHSDVYTTSYSHLKNSIVKEGDPIRKGQTIGFVGSTGWSVGPHLHYEVHKSGKAVDPVHYLPR